ncbi:MAG: Cys-tRNA(Pro) deacylase [Ruminococcaceae bacterium]|nr:Cys-tRNA(Pro) deacylase [Oscillospiraceae bacterium]
MAKETKTNAMRILDRLKIAYELNLYTCEEFHDAVQIADMLAQPYECSFKTLVAKGKSGGHYVFVIPIAEEVDLKAAAVAVGEKSVALIPVKDITALTGYVRGGVSPLGMKKVFPTVIDSRAESFERIIISGGRLGAQIFLSPQDLAGAVGAHFAPICA